MVHMICGFMISQAIYVAAKLGLADLLSDGPKASDELARATSMHAPSLYRVMRALASVGVFTETEPGVFGLTPLAETLQTDAPDSMRAMSIFMSGQCNWQAWGNILHSVKTGESSFEHIFGKSFFQHLECNTDMARIFDEAMTCNSVPFNAAVTDAYDFSSTGTLVDIGGGQGSLLVSILKANPNLKGVLFDVPHVVCAAQSLMQTKGVAERCEIVTGDFIEAVPAGGDLYMMKHIIHDLDETSAVTVLSNCRRAMSDDAKLLIIEEVIPQGNEPAAGKFSDLQMLLMPGGRERTKAEYEALLAKAGLKLTRVVPTASPLSVIEAIKLKDSRD
jgi:hypothetical protein